MAQPKKQPKQRTLAQIRKVAKSQRTAAERKRIQANRVPKPKALRNTNVNLNKGGGTTLKGTGIPLRKVKDSTGKLVLGKNQIVVDNKLFNQKHIAGLRSHLRSTGRDLESFLSRHPQRLNAIGLSIDEVRAVDSKLEKRDRRRAADRKKKR